MKTTKMIYTDPIKEKLPEGEAFLLFNLNETPVGFDSSGYPVEMWMVKMIKTGKVTERLILMRS